MKDNKREEEFFSKLDLQYSKSKEKVWDELEDMIGTEKEKNEETRVRTLSWRPLSIAASVIFLLGIGLFARFYTKEFSISKGEVSEITLPDGSMMYLNADTKVSYTPYWWTFDRSLQFEGEAFFEVRKGKKFTVYSTQGSTEVMGTSFNIYAREDTYEVYCKTGKVGVALNDNTSSVVLEPGSFASIEGEQLRKQTQANDQQILAWRMNQFLYNTTPLSKVFGDIERQYNVKIISEVDNLNTLHYTGLFSREINLEEALQIICYSFDLKYQKIESQDVTSQGTYVINSE